MPRRLAGWLRIWLVIGILAGGAMLQRPAAQAEQTNGEGQRQAAAPLADIEAPEANNYLWIAGSSFKPRSSAVEYRYMSSGCISSLSGGSTLNDSFTMSFRVPDNSVLRGVRFYYYDTSPQSSRLSITSYNGAGGFIDHVLGTSEGEGGYGNTYYGLTTPYTIDTSLRGFVLNWYPDVAGSTMRLCGARVFYDAGTPVVASEQPLQAALPRLAGLDADEAGLQSPLANDFYFLAGSSFVRPDSTITYAYGSSGCTYTTSSGFDGLSIDLNIPDGATIQGARFYYYDADPTRDINFYLLDFDGRGTVRNLAPTISSGSAGYGSIYKAIDAAYAPYEVDQFDHALNAAFSGAGSTNLQFCGVRVFYSVPAARPAHTAEPLLPAQPAAATRAPAQDAPQTINALQHDFASDLQLPDGVEVQGVRLYYYNTQSPNGYIELWNYDGSAPHYLGDTISNSYVGYASVYEAFTTPYVVDHFSESLGLVPWLVNSQVYRFCGARVFYMDGSQLRYRFIAGLSFHPRNSGSNYAYTGDGCIAVRRSSVFLPLLIK